VTARSTEAAPDARLPGTIDRTAAQVREIGRRALPVRCDLTDDTSITDLVDQALGAFGRVDILVNNAGLIYNRSFLDSDVKRLDLLYRVNVRAPFLTMKAVAPHMIARGRGHIINIGALSSSAGEDWVPVGHPLYTATKAALVRLSRSVALELHRHGIAVNALAPTGLIETEGWHLISGGRRLPNQEPGEYIGRAAAWIAAQDPRRFTGRFVHSQQVLARAGLLDHPPGSVMDLALVNLDELEARAAEPAP
jgi:NAD(P)-dependent dehydrogenase (short-subunit alcohol dehydrogenase family)